MGRPCIAAVLDEGAPFTIGDEPVGERMALQPYGMPRAFAVERETLPVVTDLGGTGTTLDPAHRLRRHARPSGLGGPQRGRERVLREQMQQIGDEQFLVLLLVMRAELDQILRRFGQIVPRRHDRAIDMCAVCSHLVQRRPRQQPARGPGDARALGLVIAVEQEGPARIIGDVTRRMIAQHEGLEEPGDVREVPFGGRGVRHRLRRRIGIGEIGGKRQRQRADAAKAIEAARRVDGTPVERVFGRRERRSLRGHAGSPCEARSTACAGESSAPASGVPRRPRPPQHIALARRVDQAAQGEEMIGQAVEIGERERIQRGACVARRDRLPLGTTHRRAGEMEVRRSGHAAGQDEARQRRERDVHRIDLALDPVDLGRHDPQRHRAGFEILARRREIGTEIEQLVLDSAEHGRRLALRRQMEQRDADRRIGFIDIAHGGDARRMLGRARSVDQPGFASVPGARIDFVELDHRASSAVRVRQQHQQDRGDHGERLELDAPPHHAVLLEARLARPQRRIAAQFLVGGAQEGDDAADQREQGPQREQDDEDEEDRLHGRALNLCRGQANRHPPGAQIGDEPLRVGAGLAQCGDRRRAVALGEAPPRRIGEQRVVVIARRRQSEQRLQQPVDMRRLEQVGAAHHVGDALPRIVDHYGEMIGGGRIFPRQHDVAESGRIGGDLARPGVMPCDRPDERHRPVHGKPPGMGLFCHSRCPFAGIEMAADPRIDRALGAVRGRGRRGDVGTRAEAGIEEFGSAQRAQRGAIGVEPHRLAHGRFVPGQAEPAQILADAFDERFAAAPGIDILDPQQEGATLPAREIVRRERGEGVAEMQPAGRTRREARDDRRTRFGNHRAGP